MSAVRLEPSWLVDYQRLAPLLVRRWLAAGYDLDLGFAAADQLWAALHDLDRAAEIEAERAVQLAATAALEPPDCGAALTFSAMDASDIEDELLPRYHDHEGPIDTSILDQFSPPGLQP